MLSCNCLNVIIELESKDKVTKDSLELSDDEKSDGFFKQDVWQVGKLVNINKTHRGLVHARHVGLWIVSHCINCDVETHAIHKERGASYVLVHSKLLNLEAINNIKSSDLFSTIFQIVVNPNESGPDNQALETYRNKDVEKVIKNINDVITNCIRKEQVAVDERIKKYSDEQYEQLNVLKDKAYREREALVRIIQNAARDGSKDQNLSPKSPKLFGEIDKFSVPNSPSATPYSPKRQKSTILGKSVDDEIDNEDLMFQFETDEFVESEDEGNENMDSENEDGEADEDGVKEVGGISIAGRNKPSASVAKSCPVDIPVFPMLSRSKNRSEVSDDPAESSTQEQVDIAASIKALAKSVHGDAIFGELPRPRFSTQI